MTLLEMSVEYANTAAILRARIAELRAARRSAATDAEVREYCTRINQLLPMLQEARELAALTAHYYDKKWNLYEKDVS